MYMADTFSGKPSSVKNERPGHSRRKRAGRKTREEEAIEKEKD